MYAETMTSATVLFSYQQRLDHIEALLSQLQARQGTTVAVLIIALVTAAALSLAFSRRALSIWYPPLPLPAALVSLRRYGRQRLQISNTVRLRRFYLGGRTDERLLDG